jgi:hypothetical protein
MNKWNLSYHRILLTAGNKPVESLRQVVKDLQEKEDTTRDIWWR